MADREFMSPEEQKKLFAEWKKDETLRRSGEQDASQTAPRQSDNALAPSPALPPLPLNETQKQEIAVLQAGLARLLEPSATVSQPASEQYGMNWEPKPLTSEVLAKVNDKENLSNMQAGLKILLERPMVHVEPQDYDQISPLPTPGRGYGD